MDSNTNEMISSLISSEPGLPAIVNVDDIPEMVEAIVEKKNYAETEMDELRIKWEDVRKAYHSEKEWTKAKGVRDPEARVHSPEMMSQIDRMVQMHTIRMIQPKVNFIKVQERKSRKRVYAMENFLFDMFKKNKFAPEIMGAVISAALYGVGFTKVIPDYSSMEPSCVLEHVSNWDIFTDPYLTSIDTAEFIIHRTWQSTKDFVNMATSQLAEKQGFIKSEVDQLIEDLDLDYLTEDSLNGDNTGRSGGTTSSSDRDRALAIKSLRPDNVSRMGVREPEPPSDTKYNRIMLYEYYDGQRVLTVAEEKYLVRAQICTINPFQAWFMRKGSAGEFWVKSHAEFILPLQQEIDQKHNQRIDNVNRITDPPLMYQKASIDDIRKLVIKSGEKYEVNNLDGLKWLEIDDATQSLMSEIQILKSDIERITGVTAVVQGLPAKGERMTNQETSNVYQQANMSFDANSSLMEITGMLPMFETIMKFCAGIFKGVPASASASPNLMGGVVELPPMAFAMDYDMTLSINPNKVAQDKQDATELYQLFSQHPNINQVSLLNWIIPRLSEDYPQDLIGPTPQMQPMPEQVNLSNNR